MNVLVLNCGSSSIKYQLIDSATERALLKGSIERIGSSGAIHAYRSEAGGKISKVCEIYDHRDAMAEILGVLGDPSRIGAVGHRVVHGGEKFRQSVLITSEVVHEMEACVELAPLHNPHNLRGYRAAVEVFPDAQQAAVFDTSFHQTLPPTAYLYGLPYVLYKKHGIRRYGFHGTSHRYVSERASRMLGRPLSELRQITCHLGNGASAAAIAFGRSVDTSMGFTPLEGLLMGTRTGDLDPALVFYLMHKEDLTEHQVTTLLNKHSGLYGVSGLTNDMAELLREEAQGNERARLAIDMFCYRVRKQIAAYAGALGGLDVLVFTAGIGENAPSVRARCAQGLAFMGVHVDPALNEAARGLESDISPPGAAARVLVIPTNEELIIARDTAALVAAAHP